MALKVTLMPIYYSSRGEFKIVSLFDIFHSFFFLFMRFLLKETDMHTCTYIHIFTCKFIFSYIDKQFTLICTQKSHIPNDIFIFQNAESDSDIWDDTALIKAYDNAVNVMKVSQIKSVKLQNTSCI